MPKGSEVTGDLLDEKIPERQGLVERCIIMGEVLEEIAGAGYVYSLPKGSSAWQSFPPPKGTELNCEAAAYLLKWLAEKRGIRGGLRIVVLKPRFGFIVEAEPGMLALGTTAPEIVTPLLSCWEFDNHYRVRDSEAGDKAYDAIFGSSGVLNPKGVAATPPEQNPVVPIGTMISDYGEKYRITRGVHLKTTVELIHGKLKASQIDANFMLSDANFALVEKERIKPEAY